MPYIKVDQSKLSSYRDSFNASASRLSNIKSEFASVFSSLDWDIKSSSNVYQRLNNISKELDTEKRSVTKMSSFIVNVNSRYFNTGLSQQSSSKLTGKITSTAVNKVKSAVLASSQAYRSSRVIGVSVKKNTSKVIGSSTIKRSLLSSSLLPINKSVLNKTQISVGTATAKKKDKYKFDIKGTLTKIGSKVGIIGATAGGIHSIVSNVSKMTSEGANPKNVAKTIKGGIDVGKGIKKLTDAWGIYKRTTNKAKVGKVKLRDRLLGFNDLYGGKVSKAKSPGVAWKNNFKKAFNKNVSDLKIKGKTKVTSKVVKTNSKMGTKGVGKAVTKTKSTAKTAKVGKAKTASKVLAWVGVGLTFVSSAYENQQEQKNSNGKMSKARAVTETVIETSVDLATGWVVGAAVAATSVALIGSAPVLLVGAVTAGITIGVDALCNWAFKKDLAECVSDGVFAIGKGIAKGAKAVGSAVVKGATKVANAAKKVGKAVKKTAKKIVSNTVKKVTSTAKKVVSVGKAVAKQAKKVVSNTVKKVATTVKKAATVVKKQAKKVVSTVKNVAKNVTKVGKAVAKQAKKVVSNTVKKVASAAKKVTSTAKKAVASVKKTVSNVGKSVSKGLKKVGSKLKGLFKRKK